MEDGGRWISEDQDETYFIWQGDLSIELPVALGHRPVDGFWPRRTTWSGGGGSRGPLTGGQVVKTRKDLKSTSVPSRTIPIVKKI